MTERVPVTFLPSGATVLVPPGTTVARAASLAGVPLPTPCGTRGICGECGVKIAFGELDEPDPTEAQTLRRASKGVRLACRARVFAPVGVKPLVSASTSSREGRVAPTDAEIVAGIDLGTTNVSVVLVDVKTGAELARASVPNRQARLGSDVLTRLTAALDGHAAELGELAEESIVEALLLATEVASAAPDRVRRAAIAGNTAMISLLVRADVASLATHPFEPPATIPRQFSFSAASSAKIPAFDRVLVVPPIGGFVGGDAAAAALATGLFSDGARRRLLVDVGTNAEVVLRTPRGLVVASAAAGPAFEGWGVSSGGRAGAGAVEHVSVTNGEMRLETAAGDVPEHFAGTGLVSALAALRGLGWIGDEGRIAEGVVPPDHLGCGPDGVLSVVVGSRGRTLPLSQLDIRALQLAKAAVRTGVDRVLHAAALKPSDLAEMLLAGAFGHRLVPSEAAAIGLIPQEVVACARPVGNAALTGAAMVAVSPEWLDVMTTTTRDARHIDLAGDESFQSDLLAALRLAP